MRIPSVSTISAWRFVWFQNFIPQDDDWMKRREIRSLESKLRNTKDKKEVVFRERKLLSERIDSLIKGIEAEMEARYKAKQFWGLEILNKPGCSLSLREILAIEHISKKGFLFISML